MSDINYMYENGSSGKLHVMLHCGEYEDLEAMQVATSTSKDEVSRESFSRAFKNLESTFLEL